MREGAAEGSSKAGSKGSYKGKGAGKGKDKGGKGNAASTDKHSDPIVQIDWSKRTFDLSNQRKQKCSFYSSGLIYEGRGYKFGDKCARAHDPV